MRIAVLSDARNLLRPEVIRPASGCSLIVHGGDFRSPEILDRLELIAPVVALG